MKYTGCIIEESLKDKSIIDEFEIFAKQVQFHYNKQIIT